MADVVEAGEPKQWMPPEVYLNHYQTDLVGLPPGLAARVTREPGRIPLTPHQRGKFLRHRDWEAADKERAELTNVGMTRPLEPRELDRLLLTRTVCLDFAASVFHGMRIPLSRGWLSL